MKQNSLIMLFTLIAFLAYGQNSDQETQKKFESEMKKGLFLHETASGFVTENMTAEHYKEVSKKYQKEWLPNYWASYIYTQLANMYGRVPDTPKEVTKVDLVNSAQGQLDIAKSRYTGNDLEVLSDIDALQAFINFLKLRNAVGQKKSETEIESLKTSYESVLKSALEKDSNNPLVYVLVGINTLGKPDGDFRDALAARTLLYKAEELFDKESKHRALSTRWNSEWLGFFWLKNADNVFNKKLGSDEN